jgi:esterase/lipase
MQKEVRARLPRIHQPVLVVQGRLDDTIAPDSGRIICDAVSSTMTEIHWMERSAHTVILDREFDAVVNLTLRFVSRALDGKDQP